MRKMVEWKSISCTTRLWNTRPFSPFFYIAVQCRMQESINKIVPILFLQFRTSEYRHVKTDTVKVVSMLKYCECRLKHSSTSHTVAIRRQISIGTACTALQHHKMQCNRYYQPSYCTMLSCIPMQIDFPCSMVSRNCKSLRLRKRNIFRWCNDTQRDMDCFVFDSRFDFNRIVCSTSSVRMRTLNVDDRRTNTHRELRRIIRWFVVWIIEWIRNAVCLCVWLAMKCQVHCCATYFCVHNTFTCESSLMYALYRGEEKMKFFSSFLSLTCISRIANIMNWILLLMCDLATNNTYFDLARKWAFSHDCRIVQRKKM